MKSFQLARIHLVTVFDARIFLTSIKKFHLLVIYFRSGMFTVYSFSKIHVLGHFSKVQITIQSAQLLDSSTRSLATVATVQ